MIAEAPRGLAGVTALPVPGPFPDTRLVTYILSEYDVSMITSARHAGQGRGNTPQAGDQCPALIVRHWNPASANLRVILDGTDDYWATSRGRGRDNGHWFAQGDPA